MGTECKDIVKVESGAFGDAATAGEILNNIRVDTAEGNRIFPGQPFSCQDEPKNCCDGAVEGVSISDYISTASATYKVGTTAFAKFAPEMYKSLTWVSKEMMLMVVPDALQTSIVGEMVGSVANFSIETAAKQIGVKVTMAAAEAIGVEVTEAGVAYAVGAVIGAIGTVLWVVAILYAIYTILSFVWKILFQCTEEDQSTSVKLTLRLCHQVGQTRINTLGMPLKRRNVYCCFNSMLARIIQEQGREQLGKGWGTPEAPDCAGFSIGDVSNLDFSAMDLSEYMNYVKSKTEVSVAEKEAAAQTAAQKIEDAATATGKTP
jgi:conjugal transfer mating pair stabilization protein TraN